MVGCNADASTYKKADKSLKNGDYAKVIELLDSIPNYNDENKLREQASAFIAFQKAAEVANTNNTNLENAINEAQNVLDGENNPLDKNTITNLQSALNSANEVKVSVPEMPKDYSAALEEATKLTETANYPTQMTNVEQAKLALEKSNKQMVQVTNPTGEFIILRLGEISGISGIQAVTEDNDPNGHLNKQSGYTSATYFLNSLVKQSVSGADAVAKGTKAGGCIEVYENAESAVKREAYLASFDGTGFLDTGSHVVCGTVVVRTSRFLTASQQKELTAQIIEKLTDIR